jgi:hypothetical protein
MQQRDRSQVRIRLLGLGLALALLHGCAQDEDAALEFDGPDDVLFNAETVSDAVWQVQGEDGVPETVEFALDGESVDAERADTLLRWQATGLDDGSYELVAQRVDAENPDAEPEELHTWTFALDTTPPEIELRSPDGALVAGEPVLVAGETEPGATVTVAGQETTADDEGRFELELPEPPAGDLEVQAVDAAGNTSEDSLTLVTVPSRVEVDHIRGVHVTPHAWVTPSFRERILEMADDGIINSVALTLKDEGGRIGWNSEVELAIESGANEGVYNLEETVAYLHERGIHVAGRIVAFRDPMLGPWARDNGHLDWLTLTTDGEPYTGRYECCFTNFAHPEVI